MDEVGILTDIGIIKSEVSAVKKIVDEIKKMIEEKYVTKIEFEPIKKIVYGMVAVILGTVLVAIIALVVAR